MSELLSGILVYIGRTPLAPEPLPIPGCDGDKGFPPPGSFPTTTWDPAIQLSSHTICPGAAPDSKGEGLSPTSLPPPADASHEFRCL